MPTETQESMQEETPSTALAETASGSSESAVSDPAAHSHELNHEFNQEPPQQAAPTLNPDLSRSIEVEAPASDVDKAYRTIVRKYARMARIPGFRAGKVPESLIRSRFARDLRQEVLDSLVSERFRAALEQGSLHPVSQPQVSELQLFEGQPLRFKATFEVLPEINIDGYDSVAVKRPDASVSDEEYQAELNALLDHHAVVEPVEEQRSLADGDWAEISFTGQMHPKTPAAEGEAGDATSTSAEETPEIKADDVLLEIGGKNTLPAFSDALRGAEAGKQLTFEVEYPAEFGDARLAGRTVSYDVTLKAIKRKTYPERDAEFAKQFGAEYESWEDFENKLRERVSERKKDTLETQARDQMLDELIKRFEFPVPETFVQQQIDARLERGLRALQQQGMTEQAMRQLNFAQLRAAQRDQAVAEVKASLILDRVAEAEHVEITDDELERELLMISIQTREPLETLRKRLIDDGSMVRIREQMRREKTGTALYERLAA